MCNYEKTGNYYSQKKENTENISNTLRAQGPLEDFAVTEKPQAYRKI